MLSRWTDFLNSDGEKNWRNRDDEFKHPLTTKEVIIESWEIGWRCLFDAIEALKEKDLKKEVFIRNMGQTVQEALNRQLGHYAYHVGQIVFIGKTIKKTRTGRVYQYPMVNRKNIILINFQSPKEHLILQKIKYSI